jgi:STE24 endopeptidase
VRAWAGDNAWVRLGVLGFCYAALLEAIEIPLDFWSGYLIEHRFGLSTQSLWGWVKKRVKGYLLGGPLGLALLAGLYALLWTAGAWWWLWAAAGWLLLTLVLGRILPVVVLPIFYKVTPLEDAGLLERFRRLAEGTGLNVTGVYRLHLSAETRKANAALAGLGSGRRVLLGDTLLDQFGPDEIEVVFAHELGHFVYRHILWMTGVSVVLAAVGFWVVDVLGRRLVGPLGYPVPPGLEPPYADPSALPVLLLVLSVFGLLTMPATNALSRWFERQCDRYALRRTGNPSAFRAAFSRLARLNKADPDPHPLEVWCFHDHPSIRARLALADAHPGATP